MMKAADAVDFVEKHGVVFVAAKGRLPRLVEAILGEPIRGSWWAHPRSHAIFAVLQQVAESADLLVCRLVDGKVTLVHRRLWPALVRLQRRFTRQQLAQIREEHTPLGKHVNRTVEFPVWVPERVRTAARGLSTQQAERILAAVLRGGMPVAATKASRPRPAAGRRPRAARA